MFVNGPHLRVSAALLGAVVLLGFTGLPGASGVSPQNQATLDGADSHPLIQPTQAVWHASGFAPVTSENTEEAEETGQTQAGQIPDPHPATVQLLVGGTSGKVSLCSGVWVAPERILTAKHCFSDFPSGPVRIYPNNSLVDGVKPLAMGLTWDSAEGSDLAVLITSPSEHPTAPVLAKVLPPATPLQVCGQNYITSASTDIKTEAKFLGGKGNFCANVKTFDSVLAKKWDYNPAGNVIRTLPLAVEHGDSGGPLYDSAGRVVGVTSSKMRATFSTGESLSFNATASIYPHVNWLIKLGVPVIGSRKDPLVTKPLPPGISRIGGANRLETSAKVVDATPNPQTLILTTGLVAADGLAATQIAGASRAALILSNSRDKLDPQARNALNIQGLKRVVRVGGTVGMSDADRKAIQSKNLELVELLGTDRFDTAVKVAKYRDQIGAKAAFTLLADGVNFPDALAAGAAAGLMKASLVLTSQDRMPSASLEYLRSSGVPVVAVGGPATRAADGAGISPQASYVGANRYETSLKLAMSLSSQPASGLVFVSGVNFPDALSAGTYTVKQGGRLVLVPPAGRQARMYVNMFSQAGKYGVIIGGTGAISDQDVAYAVS